MHKTLLIDGEMRVEETLVQVPMTLLVLWRSFPQPLANEATQLSSERVKS